MQPPGNFGQPGFGQPQPHQASQLSHSNGAAHAAGGDFSPIMPPSRHTGQNGPAPSSVLVSVDTGESAQVRGLLVIGRAPSRSENEAHADLLTVNDPSLSVSKSHLAVELDASGLWVTDRNSTNGSWIDEGRGALRPVAPYQRTPVPAGARVLIGERVLTFTRA